MFTWEHYLIAFLSGHSCIMTCFQLGKTYSYLFSFAKSNKTSCENNFLEGNTILENKCSATHFNHVLPTNWIGRWLLTTKKPMSCRNCFCCTTSFLKGSFAPKMYDMSKWNTLSLFFVSFYFQYNFH